MLAMWYYHSAEGQRFLQARELRAILAAAGVLAAYVLWRTRAHLTHQDHCRSLRRLVISAIMSAALWLAVDFVRGEHWIFDLLTHWTEIGENGLRYLVLIGFGWIGWTIAFFEILRRFTIAGQHHPTAK